MNLDVTQNITKDDLRLDPCPYFHISQALPWPVYDQLAAEYPEQHMMADGKKHFQARRYRQHEFVPGTVSPLWQDFVDYHTSVEFKNRVLDLFEPAIDKYYREHAACWRQAAVAPRNHKPGTKRSDIVAMELQFVLNGQQEHTPRTPHLDNAKELFAGLLYMRKPGDASTGGEIQVYRRLIDSPQFSGIREVNLDHVEPAGRVPYEANHMILFLNTRDTIHGVVPRIGAQSVRRYINIDAHQRFRLFELPT